ncbi:hypothetical protein G3O08_06630 [Cryomorpha ignava]|uniref:DUF4412 domain-containing protein n=1 Tax=Cryomorpha ignava TaxID=101383 RepID=A0A7K3WNE4_9FLAO|nr:hypothetical protein [Cryomorpha ignava]NEN23173.1 hypothetical protein [Cryomorpha ignava]
MSTNTPETSRYTALIIKLLWLTPILIMGVLIVACNKISPGSFSGNINEGIIEYKVSFPEMGEESLTATLMPEIMIYAFKENAFASYFEAAGGVFKNRIIADRNLKTVEHQLKVFRKKVKVMMDETEVLQMLAEYPKMQVIETEVIDTIAGYPCQKAIIVFEDVEKSQIDVYYTKAIDMEKPNWCTQYHEIDGVLMAYEIVEFGIRMRLEAISVRPEKVMPDLLNPKEDFTPISKESMDVELSQLVETFEL